MVMPGQIISLYENYMFRPMGYNIMWPDLAGVPAYLMINHIITKHAEDFSRTINFT